MRALLVFNALDALLALAAAIILFGTSRAGPVFIAAAFCLVIAVHQIFSLIFNVKLQLRLKRARMITPEAIAGETETETHALNPADAGLFTDARGSVTESTTELLEAAPRIPDKRPTR